MTSSLPDFLIRLLHLGDSIGIPWSSSRRTGSMCFKLRRFDPGCDIRVRSSSFHFGSMFPVPNQHSYGLFLNWFEETSASIPVALSAPALSALFCSPEEIERRGKCGTIKVHSQRCHARRIGSPKFMSSVPRRVSRDVVFIVPGRSMHVINDPHDLASQPAGVSSQGQVKLHSPSHLRRT